MNLLKTVMGVIMVIAVLTVFGQIRQKVNLAAASAPVTAAADHPLSAAGFFLLSREDARNPRVTIMSPPNCPSDEARRAQALAESLKAVGIPCELKQEIGFTFTNPDDVARVNKSMANLATPLVLVRGWAKGNPSAQDVIVQFQAGK
jgi:hypothetical protein